MELSEIKAQYFREKITAGIKRIFQEQRVVASERIYAKSTSLVTGRDLVRSRSGELMAALSAPKYMISNSGEGIVAEVQLPQYIRFLDMKQKGNKRIYNRQIWGILYSDTLSDVKYEFRDWINRHFPELLNQFNNQ